MAAHSKRESVRVKVYVETVPSLGLVCYPLWTFVSLSDAPLIEHVRRKILHNIKTMAELDLGLDLDPHSQSMSAFSGSSLTVSGPDTNIDSSSESASVSHDNDYPLSNNTGQSRSSGSTSVNGGNNAAAVDHVKQYDQLFSLWLDGCILPSSETSEILHDGDSVTLKLHPVNKECRPKIQKYRSTEDSKYEKDLIENDEFNPQDNNSNKRLTKVIEPQGNTNSSKKDKETHRKKKRIINILEENTTPTSTNIEYTTVSKNKRRKMDSEQSLNLGEVEREALLRENPVSKIKKMKTNFNDKLDHKLEKEMSSQDDSKVSILERVPEAKEKVEYDGEDALLDIKSLIAKKKEELKSGGAAAAKITKQLHGYNEQNLCDSEYVATAYCNLSVERLSEKRKRKRKPKKKKKTEDVNSLVENQDFKKNPTPPNYDLNLPKGQRPMNSKVTFASDSDVDELSEKEGRVTDTNKDSGTEETDKITKSVFHKVPEELTGQKAKEYLSRYSQKAVGKSVGASIDPQSKFSDMLRNRRHSTSHVNVTMTDGGLVVCKRQKNKVQKSFPANAMNPNYDVLTNVSVVKMHPISNSSSEERRAQEISPDVATTGANQNRVSDPQTEFEVQPVDLDYSSCSQLVGQPRVGDFIAYKILELSEDYTPNLSEFKGAKVIESDEMDGTVQVKMIGNSGHKRKRQGKFELNYEDDKEAEDLNQDADEMVLLTFSSLVDVRLVSRNS